MQTQMIIRKRFIEAQRMPLRKISERHKRRMEERRLRKIETEGEGKMILRAERLERENLHADAIRCWLDLGMEKRAMETVRKNHSEEEVLRTASASGLQEGLKQLFAELGEKLGKRQASDLAHRAGLREEAYNLALEHIAATSEGMPLVFQGKGGRKFASVLESEGNFGAAGRMYERLGRQRKALKMYMKGGYPEEAARLLKNHFFLGGYELAKKAFQNAAEMGKKGAFLRDIGGFDGLRDLKKKEVLSYSALGGAAFITAAAFTHPVIFTTLLLGSPFIAVFCYMCVGAKKYPFVELAVPNFTETSSKEKPGPLPEHPAVLSMEEAVKYSCASTEEKAKRLLSRGMVFEAGTTYMKDGMLHKAIECAWMLEEKDAAKARELKILIFGKTYLEAEELAKTDPDAAKEILSVLGLRPPTIPPLIEHLKDEDKQVRCNAAWALGEIKDASAVPALIERLSDNEYFVRCLAAEALGKIGDASAVPALSECLEDENNDVRTYAVKALGKIGSHSAVCALTAFEARLNRKLTRTHEEFWLNREVGYALRVIETRRLFNRP